jgi:dipeptidyl aminopeptidase/acylaminoacyl peptidase
VRVALLVLAFLIVAAPARAEVRVFDAATGTSRVVVADRKTQLAGWTDDTGLLIERSGLQRLDLANGMLTPLPKRFGEALSISPGGRTAQLDAETLGLTISAPDGHVVVRLDTSIWTATDIAWSRDGGRVAVSGSNWFGVYDTATGAQLTRLGTDLSFTPQAFSPDGTEFLATATGRIVRIDLTTGKTTTLYASKDWFPDAAWSPDGRIALRLDKSIAIVGQPSIPVVATGPALWSADGTTLSYFPSRDEDCSYAVPGLAVVKPGQPPRTLIEPETRGANPALWSPTAASLAFFAGSDPVPEQRGKRHPWPKRVARHYHLSKRGNAALRRLVLRAARALKHGAGREETLQRVRQDYLRVDDRFDGAMDTIVREKVADEIDAWLIAAGFEPIEAYDEITC